MCITDHFAVYMKLTQYCKLTILKISVLKKKLRKTKKRKKKTVKKKEKVITLLYPTLGFNYSSVILFCLVVVLK